MSLVANPYLPRAVRTSKKRSLDSPDYGDAFDGDADFDNQHSAAEVSDALNALGYMPHDHHLVLGNGSGPKVSSFLPRSVRAGDCETD